MHFIRFFAVALVCLPATILSGQETETTPPATEKPAAEAPAAPDEKSTMQKASFLLGYNFIKNLQSNGLEVDQESLMKGIQLAMKGEEMPMAAEEIDSVMQAVQAMVQKKQIEMQKKQMEMQAKLAEDNLAEGQAYIEKYAAQADAKMLEDGIHKKVMKAGEGAVPTKTDKVKINYKGTFTDGTVFDESKGEPLVLGVSNFVGGFSTALQNMKVGEKAQVVIRGDKAYGMNPPPGFPPNKTLVFEIDLLEIVK
ncbi:MAG: FKBP-type peptidyl-prolyl cis-trans isomerase [Mariniblastus sp.]|nr:FKBP-type peptidyl-prolyl cis-trans isomerase [Mariniblastus sp.]